MFPEHQLEALRLAQIAPSDSLRRKLARSCGKYVAGRLPGWSAKPAADRLSGRLQKILVDNSVLAHRCVSFTGDSGRTGHLVQERSYTEDYFKSDEPGWRHFKNLRFWEDRKYFYGISDLAISGFVLLFDSYELAIERVTQPLGRFTEMRSIYTEDVFESVEFQTLNPHGEMLRISPEAAIKAQEEWNRRGRGLALDSTQRIPKWLAPDIYETHGSTNDRIAGYGDSLYPALLDVLGGRKFSKDAWHIVTAERHGLDCFMTMDYKLIDRLGQLRKKEPVRSLAVKVLTPSQWGGQQGVRPIQKPDLVGELAGRRRPDPYYREPEEFLTRDQAVEKVWHGFLGNEEKRR